MVAAVILVCRQPWRRAERPKRTAPKMAVLPTTITITGGMTFTGAYDDRLGVRTCADVAKGGTGATGGTGGAMFNVPDPPPRIPAAIPGRWAAATPSRPMLRPGLITAQAHTRAPA